MSRRWHVCSRSVLLGLILTACSGSARAALCLGEPDLDIWQTDLTGAAAPLVRGPGMDGFADWSPDGEEIVFVSSRDGNCDLYLMDADGADQVNLTESGRDELYPSWSANGRQVVFSADEQLHIIDVASGEVAQLTNTRLIHSYPDWSPDGDFIVFSGGSEPAGPGVVHQIYVVPVAGGDEQPLTDGDSLLVAPRWSPDGRHIAYFDHAEPFQIYVIDSDDGAAVALGHGGHLSWSPDGALVHDREVAPGDVDLFVDDAPLIGGPGIDTLPAWSPDGSVIVFSSDRP